MKARTDLADYKVLYFATHGLLPQPSACLPEPALMTSVGLGDSDGQPGCAYCWSKGANVPAAWFLDWTIDGDG